MVYSYPIFETNGNPRCLYLLKVIEELSCWRILIPVTIVVLYHYTVSMFDLHWGVCDLFQHARLAIISISNFSCDKKIKYGYLNSVSAYSYTI